ncbi:MAG: PTS ascorbate transporter subunit IIC [Eubacteriales bacterium]
MSIIRDFLTSAEVLIGLVVLIGLAVQKKSFEQIITGTAKTIMGIMILSAGAGVLVSALSYLTPLMQEAFHVDGIAPLTNAFVAVAMGGSYGTTTAYIILGAFVVNLLLARFTPFKYIFLAGHHILYISVVMAVTLAANHVFGIQAAIIGSLFAGVAMTLLPAINQKFMNKITGDEPIAMGHFGATGYWLAGFVGKFVGNPKHSTEDLKIPKALNFAKETIIAATMVIILLFSVCIAFTGVDFVRTELEVTKNVVLFILLQGLTFGAGLTILMQGVRMMVSEILTAFEGIAAKVVPNAIPALDCPVVFPYAPNAVLIGFLSATVGGILTSVVFAMFTGIGMVPPVIEFFFMGGAAGVFGNATGGRNGAIVGGIIQGILFTILPYYFWLETNVIVPGTVTMTDPDFCWSGIILGNLIRLFN